MKRLMAVPCFLFFAAVAGCANQPASTRPSAVGYERPKPSGHRLITTDVNGDRSPVTEYRNR
jgi:hypothetical protein